MGSAIPRCSPYCQSKSHGLRVGRATAQGPKALSITSNVPTPRLNIVASAGCSPLTDPTDVSTHNCSPSVLPAYKAFVSCREIETTTLYRTGSVELQRLCVRGDPESASEHGRGRGQGSLGKRLNGCPRRYAAHPSLSFNIGCLHRVYSLPSRTHPFNPM